MRLILLALLAGCAVPGTGSWVAFDGEVAIAVTREDGRTLAYSCGATPALVGSHTAWFDDAGTSADWVLSIDEHPEGLEVTLDGLDTRSLVATPAIDPLYEDQGDCRHGAILTDDVAVGRWCSPEGLDFQVEPLEWSPGAAEATLQVLDRPEIFTARIARP